VAKSRKTKHVAMAVPLGLAHYATMIRGILRYAVEDGRWSVAFSPDLPIVPISSLRGWSGDGAVVMINTPAEARLVKESQIPAVDVSGALQHTGVPRVTVDNRALGRQAAEHLLECGFRRFAYYGVPGFWYAEQRGAGFTDAVEAAGGTCSSFYAPNKGVTRASWSECDQPLCDWLKSLSPPLGMFVCHDYRARLILEACRQVGLRVPDELALLGVNNDPIACEFCDPPLSSVSRSAERVGYAAAGLLDRLMAGKAPPAGDILVPPDGVVQRRSTDVVAIDNPEVATAVRYMYAHLAESINIDDVVQQQGISRRWLEHAFCETLGQAPHRYLTFLRIRRARELLLTEPRPTLLAVANECGFSDVKRLRAAFTRIVGVGPSRYRQLHCQNTT
jgi:LacI family transcriptional regulator